MTENMTVEAADILAMLAEQRDMLLITVRGLDDAGARARSTASDLTLGGLIKHVSATESGWIDRIRELDENAVFDMDSAMVSYYMSDDETSPACWTSMRRWRLRPRSSSQVSTSTCRFRSRPHRGRRSGNGGVRERCCCTSSAKQPTTVVMPTSFASRSTVRTPPCNAALMPA